MSPERMRARSRRHKAAPAWGERWQAVLAAAAAAPAPKPRQPRRLTSWQRTRRAWMRCLVGGFPAALLLGWVLGHMAADHAGAASAEQRTLRCQPPAAVKDGALQAQALAVARQAAGYERSRP